jgi:hypothetical protein
MYIPCNKFRLISYQAIFLLYLTVILILNLDCTERSPDNPFDPGSHIHSPVNLSLEPQDKTVRLHWEIKDIKDFVGFRIYKAIGDSSKFFLLKELPAETRSYLDTTLQYYQLYSYRVSVQGYDIESSLSNRKEYYPGPNQVMILSKYGYSLHQFSYDLKYRLAFYNTNYLPYNWDIDLLGNCIWYTIPQYHSISRINLSSKFKDTFSNPPLYQPIDIKWDMVNRRALILDQIKKQIYIFENQNITDSLQLDSDTYFKMHITSHADIASICDSNAIIFIKGTNLSRTITFESGYIGKDITSCDDFIYFLVANTRKNISLIIKLGFEEFSPQILELSGIYNLLRVHKKDQYFWASEVLEQNINRCVKLSYTGQRLLELTSQNEIEDIQINMIDHSLLVVERYEDRISLFNSTGTKISENVQVYDPIRVLIIE